jgi:dTDP-4-dehydrorhamnose 3,5-epimerase
MKFLETEIPGVYLIEPNIFQDERGIFIKTFHETTFKELKLDCDFKENLSSRSRKGVIRGMHFQTPPYECAKLVYVAFGRIIDVVLDVRKGSPTYGKFIAVDLSELFSGKGKMIYIPKGCAHGFLALEENSTVVYPQTAIYSAEHDKGIRWDSFGMDWGIENPIVSKKDSSFPKLEEFNSPFIW